MSALAALLLGVVQGLTEFLPVSSSGHLVIAQALLGVAEHGLLLEIATHVATLGSVLLVYRARVRWLALGCARRRPDALRYAAKLGVATLPAVVAALLFGDFLEAQFETPAVTGGCLLVTGALLWTTRFTTPRATALEPGFAVALGIGVAQAFAILPGISRIGATLAAALALGVAPLAAAEFSFLMSVVAIAGAAVRALPELSGASPQALSGLALAFAAAFVAGVLAIRVMVRLLRSQHLHRFAWYTWAVGAGFLLWLAVATG